jgi:hypothetical protein
MKRKFITDFNTSNKKQKLSHFSDIIPFFPNLCFQNWLHTVKDKKIKSIIYVFIVEAEHVSRQSIFCLKVGYTKRISPHFPRYHEHEKVFHTIFPILFIPFETENINVERKIHKLLRNYSLKGIVCKDNNDKKIIECYSIYDIQRIITTINSFS